MVQSVSSFCNYLVGYYSKYFPGSFFINYAITGVADSLTGVYAKVLERYFPKVVDVIRFALMQAVIWCLIFIVL
jgi:hypothetical protein